MGLLPPSLRQLVRGLGESRATDAEGVRLRSPANSPCKMVPSPVRGGMTRPGQVAAVLIRGSGWNLLSNRRRIDSVAREHSSIELTDTLRNVKVPSRRVHSGRSPPASRDQLGADRERRRLPCVFGVVLPGKPRDPVPDAPILTSRQNQVLQLLGEGASTEQIAAMLHVSKETVRNHIRHILRALGALGALGAHSRLEAVALAHRQGLLHED